MTEEVPGAPAHSRLAVLDGWRALSILLVLAGHLLPLKLPPVELNAAVAAMGMVIFFNLSGFLITRFLVTGAELRAFVIRRFFRILPLAWVGMAAAFLIDRASGGEIAANLLFYANLPPQRLLHAASHLWSLCVEIQFYVAIAIVVALFGRRSLLVAVPLACVAVTLTRIATGTEVSIVTWLRIDEILAGGVVALAHVGWLGERPRAWLAAINPWWLMPLVLASAHEATGPLNYLRPYLSATMVGATLYAPPVRLRALLESRAAHYLATISYALYIVHGVLRVTWLGTGDTTLVKYAKRPLLFAVTFALAHLSTYRFEQPLIGLAKRLTPRRADPPRDPVPRPDPVANTPGIS